MIDSWDVWDELGYLKIASRINWFLLISFIIIVIVYSILIGFNGKLLLFAPLIISQLVLYQLQMRRKKN